MTAEERGWVEGALEASDYMMEQRLRLPRAPHPTIIVFNERCRFEMKEGSSRWATEPHSGKIRLLRGGGFPAGIIAMADYDQKSGDNFFLIALPSVWRAAKAIGPDEEGPTPVFMHEFAHSRQILALQPLFDAADAKYKAPDNDDSLQAYFKDDPAYVAVWEKETALLYRAAAEPDDAKARALAKQALALMEARQKRWFTGADAMWKPYDDLYLSMEGFAQWIPYAWLSDPNGGAMTAAAAQQKMRGSGRQWSQEQGLGLYLLIARFVPDWAAQSFASPPKLGIDLLRQIVADAPATPPAGQASPQR